MRQAEKGGAWSLYEWVVVALLGICAALLVACTALMRSYFPVIASGSNSTRVTKYESRIDAALAALQQQQALSNTTLEAIRNELHALNEKAGTAANVAPPPSR